LLPDYGELIGGKNFSIIRRYRRAAAPAFWARHRYLPVRGRGVQSRKPSDRISILAVTPSRLIVLSGEPMDGPRHIWWNFVHSSKERIDQAKEDWRAKRLGLVSGDEKDFIPLPG
jgi:hypothetical protein